MSKTFHLPKIGKPICPAYAHTGSGTKAGCLSMPLQGCLFSSYCFKLPLLREGPWFHTATQFTEQVSAVREDKLRKLLLA